MQSPFKVFRKYQKQVMAVMVFVALILFGIGDTVMKMTGKTGGRDTGKVVVETSVGKLTQLEMQNLQYRRRQIQRFVYAAFQQSHPDLGFYAQMAVRQYGFGGTSEVDMLEFWLQSREARELGIVVTNRQVEEYIDGVTSRKLSSKKFQEIVRNLQLGPKELFDYIRDELQAQTAGRMQLPSIIPSPEKYWEYFQELHVRQKIEVAALPVSDFTAQTSEPTEAQITKLFEDRKEDFDSDMQRQFSNGNLVFDGEFKPGFRQPPKVKLQYLTMAFADFETKAKAGAPITDKEIEDYYEAKKAFDRRFQEGEVGLDDDASPLDPTFAPEKGEKMPRDQEDQPGEKADSVKKSKDESEANKEKPEDKPQEPEKPQTEKPEAAKPENKPDCAPGTDDEPKAEAAAESDKPAKQAEDKADEKDKTKAAQTDESKAPKKENKDEEPGDDADEAPDAPKGPTLSPDKSKPHVAPQIKYKPLDDALRDVIRETILHQRAQKLMQDQIAKVRDAMSKVAAGFAVSTEVKLTDPDAKQLVELERRAADELRKIGETFGLKYDETRLLSQVELSELPELGKAKEPGDFEQLRGEAMPLYEQAFDGDALCRVFESQDPLETHTYLWWKVEHAPMHVPDLQEPGIREQVIAALKRQAAIGLAEKRANELAEKVPKGEKTIAEALAGQTVTGDAKGPELKFEESKEFSFWREPTVPNFQPGAPRQVDLDDPGIGKNPRSRKFMQKVFNQMNVGDVGVTLSGDASIYYVIKVVSRQPADREAFKDALLFAPNSPYATIAQRDQQPMMMERGEQFRKKYAIKWRNVSSREQASMDTDDE